MKMSLRLVLYMQLVAFSADHLMYTCLRASYLVDDSKNIA